MNELQEYEQANFKGIDVSLEISLYEYGLIWGKNKECAKDEFLFIYGIEVDDSGEYIKFDSGYMTKESFKSEFYFQDNKIKDVLNYLGNEQTKEEIIDNFPDSIFDIMSYYGFMDIFGDSYGSGFTIKGENYGE